MQKRRITIFLGLIAILISSAEIVTAQKFVPYYRLRMLRFNVEWHGIKNDPRSDSYTGYLKWELDKAHPDPGLYYIKFRGTVESGVYHVVRMLPDKSYEVYGQGEELILNSRQQGLKIILDENVDLSKPYIIKKDKQQFKIFNYLDTTEILKLFATLNEWLYQRVIPKANGEGYEHKLFQKTALEMGSAITFKGKKDWRWEKKSDGEVLSVDN